MESLKEDLKKGLFEHLDEHLDQTAKAGFNSSQLNEILHCVVDWVYQDRAEISTRLEAIEPEEELEESPEKEEEINFMDELKKL
jgi:hypothetical protein